MSNPHDSKPPVTVNIYNQDYTIVPLGDPAALEAAAASVHEVMMKIGANRSLDTMRTAVLAALHFSQRVQLQQQALDDMRSSMEKRTREIAALLDGLVSHDDEPSSKR